MARNGAVGIDGAVLVDPDEAFDLSIDMPHADVRPGLINAHDHLHRNHYGRLGKPPYANAAAWAADLQQRCAADIAAGRALTRRDALLEGAWKNLLAGVTTVVHHDRWERDFDRAFPLNVVRIAQADSLAMGASLDQFDTGKPYCLHVAEGVDAAAGEEVRTLDRAGFLSPSLIAVHGIGMDDDAVARFRASGAALVWCPSSNLFLFGRTAPDAVLAVGVDVLLGSDSCLTADGDLLDELRCAKGLGSIDDARLETAVGATAARVLGLPPPSLEPGSRADLILLARPLLNARARDVALVVIGGEIRVLDPDLVGAFGAWLPPGVMRTRGNLTRWTSTH